MEKINQAFFSIESMCVTIILHKKNNNFPVIIGNNRDEMINRKFLPPQILSKSPLIYGPKDLERGGTWLGINEYGIVVNILNKWTGNKNFFGSEKYTSRGQLVLNLLKKNSIENILNELKRINPNDYLPFHILIANKEKAIIVIKNKNIHFYDISEKIFILGNLDPFDKWEKYEYGYNFIKNNDFSDINNIEANLKELLKFHKGDKNIPSTDYAVDIGDFKTTSSSIIFMNNEIIFKFLNGFPGKSEYKIYSFF